MIKEYASEIYYFLPAKLGSKSVPSGHAASLRERNLLIDSRNNPNKNGSDHTDDGNHFFFLARWILANPAREDEAAEYLINLKVNSCTLQVNGVYII
ncbi:hypothetical protein [Psychrobacillus psychrotolerans]|uniref:hypothetical protein n=1 Tax=Psychrobacillus psychrotolerans TaxID=126156 RepID=UPI003B02BC77